jgi:UDP-GlcNAc:undecaprenyl-phosphate GlcNAc-1-phosphate transferase
MQGLIEVFQKYQYFGWLAFVAAVFLTPVAIRVAHRYKVLDIPDQKLKPHARPIPYLGGTAICVAWALALVAGIISGVVQDWAIMLPLLLGGVAMSVLGLVDDVRHVPPKLRLLVGTVIITVVIVLSGAGLHLVDSVLLGISSVSGVKIVLPGFVTTPLSVLVGVFVVLGACNSTNLIDGLDGLSTGVTGIISFGFFVLAAHLAVWGYSESLDPIRLVLAIAMFGAALGFLPWNFNPARIFMGDAGSVLLGYNCGMLILLFAQGGTFRWVVGALMIFALPVFDTALAMFRRWRAGRSIFEGDRSHFYDQLVQRGLTVKQTVMVCYALTLCYAAIGLLLAWVSEDSMIRTRYTVLISIGVVVGTALVAWFAGLTHPEEPRDSVSSPSDTD